MLVSEPLTPALLLSAVTAVSAAMTYPKLMARLGKYKLRVMGVPFRSANVLQDLVSMSVFVSIGVTIIQALRGDVPVWASLFIPALTTALIVGYTAVRLWPRERFKPKRFFDLVLSPVLAGISPSWPTILNSSSLAAAMGAAN